MKTSDEIKNVIGAMNEVSKGLENPQATADNPFFHSKYTPLDKLIDHIKPLLNQHNLIVMQSPEYKDGNICLVTKIFHSSGEWIETETSVPIGIDAQKTGANITYARRYALSAMFNISSETDNDANETAAKPQGSDKKIDFEEVRQKISTMNIEEMNNYSKELGVNYSFTEKQKEALKKIFSARRGEINQDTYPATNITE